MGTTKSSRYVLVTGAGGLLGGWVVKRLVSLGYQVLATDFGDIAPLLSTNILAEQGDIRDRDFVSKMIEAHDIGQIVHCAGLLQFACEREPELAVQVNVQGTMNLLTAAQRAHVGRVVMMSTSAIYGDQTSLLDEDALVGVPHGLIGVYPATKWLAERVGLALRSSENGPEFVGLRLGFVFGLGRPRSAGLSEVMQRVYGSLLRGEAFQVAEAGGGEIWHFVHILDVCDAIVAALSAPGDSTGIYNVAGPAEMHMSLNTFIDEVSNFSGQPSKGLLLGRATSGPRLETRRLAERLGFTPQVTIERAVRHDLSRAELHEGAQT